MFHRPAPPGRCHRILRFGGYLADALPFLIIALLCLFQFLAFLKTALCAGI